MYAEFCQNLLHKGIYLYLTRKSTFKGPPKTQTCLRNSKNQTHIHYPDPRGNFPEKF